MLIFHKRTYRLLPHDLSQLFGLGPHDKVESARVVLHENGPQAGDVRQIDVVVTQPVRGEFFAKRGGAKK